MKNWRDMVNIVSKEITDSGKTIGEISRDTGKSRIIVSRIWYKTSYTRGPSMHTLLDLLEYFGYDVEVRKVSNSGEVIKITHRKKNYAKRL